MPGELLGDAVVPEALYNTYTRSESPGNRGQQREIVLFDPGLWITVEAVEQTETQEKTICQRGTERDFRLHAVLAAVDKIR